MKFKKYLVTFALFPLLLTSCSDVISRERAKAWVSKHYTATETRKYIRIVSWDFHATKGDLALNYVENKLSSHDISPLPQNSIGRRVILDTRISPVLEKDPLNKDNFNLRFPEQNFTFRISDNNLTATCNYNTQDDHKFSETRVEYYNSRGYMKGLGYKIGYGYIDKKNIVKVKIIEEYVYSDF